MNLVNEELQKTNPEHTTAGTLKVVKISIDEDVTFLGMLHVGNIFNLKFEALFLI